MKFWLVRIGSILLALGAVVLLDVVSQGASDFSQRLIVLAGLYITLSVSLNLINGITGQFSIGHAAFYQVGAYTAGYLTVAFYGKLGGISGIPWLIGMMLVGGAAAGIAGLIVGLPSLRLKGDYLAIVTLGFGEIIRIIVQNQTVLGGSYGFNVQPKFAALFGSTGTTGVWLVWLLAIFTIALSRNLLKTAHGLPFLAVREDEIASSAMGVNVTNVKVIAFVMGSMLAGAAGVLLAHFEGFISPQTFSMDLSFIILTMVVLGGTGSITGSVLAAGVLFYLPEKLRDLPPIPAPLLFGAVVASIAMVVVMKRISDKYSGPKLRAAGLYFGTVFAAILVAYLLGFCFATIPAIAKAAPIEASKLRMVIFAATLVSLMLLRPQGVLGHYELSWNWLLRKKLKTRAEAA